MENTVNVSTHLDGQAVKSAASKNLWEAGELLQDT